MKNETKFVMHKVRNQACAEGLWPQEAEYVEDIRKMRGDRRGEANAGHKGLTVMLRIIMFIFKNNNMAFF